MAKVVQLRRGTTEQVLNYTGVVSELVVDTTKDIITVHDGSQAGGHPMMSSEGGVFTGNVSQTADDQATSRTTGAFKTAGGLGVSKDIWAQAIYDNERRVFTEVTTSVPSVLGVSKTNNVLSVIPQDSGVVANTLGDGGNVPVITVDRYGRVTTFTSTPGGAQIAVEQEESVDATRYIPFSPQSNGSISQLKVDSTFYYNPSSNFLYCGNYLATSDVSLKENINSLENCLDKVLKLRGVSFNYKDSGIECVGVIAQEIEKVFPELISEVDGFKSVNYDALVPIILQAIQEQQVQIKELKTQLGN